MKEPESVELKVKAKVGHTSMLHVPENYGSSKKINHKCTIFGRL